MCRLALAILFALLAHGVLAYPIGYCGIVASLSVSAYVDADGGGHGITASGEHTQHGVMAAGGSIPFGTWVYVPGYGVGHVADRGGEIGDGNLDVWVETEEEARAWGRKQIPVILFWPVTPISN